MQYKKIVFLLWLVCIMQTSSLTAEDLSSIQDGSTVTFHYTLKVDGKITDSSEGKNPVTYVHGRKQLISGLEDKMKGLKRGEKRHISVPPKIGYGEVNPKAFQKYPRSSFDNLPNIKVGDSVTGVINGRPTRAKVAKISKNEVTLDLNHPLAGKTLEFDIEVLEVSETAAKKTKAN